MFVQMKFKNKHLLDGLPLKIESWSTDIPEYYVERYKKNVLPLTPRRTSWLRRSLTTQVLGQRGRIAWRAAYAEEQNLGYHMEDGRMVKYKQYTTPGTGRFFADKARRMTDQDLDQFLKEVTQIK